MGNHSGLDSGTSHQRDTDFNLLTISNHQYLVQYNLAVDVCRYLFYFEFFANGNFVLLATGFYDREHRH